MAKPKKPATQRARLILTDNGDGSGIKIVLEFDPSIKNKPVTSPAVAAAMIAMEAVPAEAKRQKG